MAGIILAWRCRQRLRKTSPRSSEKSSPGLMYMAYVSLWLFGLWSEHGPNGYASGSCIISFHEIGRVNNNMRASLSDHRIHFHVIRAGGHIYHSNFPQSTSDVEVTGSRWFKFRKLGEFTSVYVSISTLGC
jgi:hypothetical protein